MSFWRNYLQRQVRVYTAPAREGAALKRVHTAKHFDRDPQTNEVLWFASPPVDVAPPVQKPRHSFAYLHHLAKKRKLELEKKDVREGEDSRMDVDAEESPNSSVVGQPKMSTDEAWQRAVAQFS